MIHGLRHVTSQPPPAAAALGCCFGRFDVLRWPGTCILTLCPHLSPCPHHAGSVFDPFSHSHTMCYENYFCYLLSCYLFFVIAYLLILFLSFTFWIWTIYVIS